VRVSTDGTTWPTALEETRNIRNLDNRAKFPVDLSGLDGESQVLGFSIGDSQPDDGWGACCYQHVTDTVRADVASQVGSLIWEARTEGATDETVTVRRHSLATILQLVEDGLLKHEVVNDLDLAELQAAQGYSARKSGIESVRRWSARTS
jgi:hypothetical protein